MIESTAADFPLEFAHLLYCPIAEHISEHCQILGMNLLRNHSFLEARTFRVVFSRQIRFLLGHI